jgi:hypothetical protein
MPYVEGFGTYPFGEEWLFDAVVRSYVPVTELADRLTMTVTPVLADQLEAPGVAERLLEFTRTFRVRSCEADVEDVEPDLRDACRAEAARYGAALARLEALDGDLLRLFAEPAEEGRVELIPSTATHAVLPLVATLAGRRLSSTPACARTGAASASRPACGSPSARTSPAWTGCWPSVSFSTSASIRASSSARSRRWRRYAAPQGRWPSQSTGRR